MSKETEEPDGMGVGEEQEGTEVEPEFSGLEKRSIDLAWRTEGLQKVLKEKGKADDAGWLDMVQLGALFMRHGENSEEQVGRQIQMMEKLIDENDDYDSGKRKFEKTE